MAIQRHPIDQYEPGANFWEVYPDYRIHRLFGSIYNINKLAGAKHLEQSSLFMWALSLCYDRKSAMFPQPELDKWEVVSEQLFGEEKTLEALSQNLHHMKFLDFPEQIDSMFSIIDEFEKTMDTPLGIALRLLEKKLIQRTKFIHETEYTMDYYETTGSGRRVLKKGTADQLDKMFTNTEKINSLIQKAMDQQTASEGLGTAKGDAEISLGDSDKQF